VWKNEPRPVNAVLPATIALRTDLAPDLFALARARGFIELLRDLGPCLDTSLTVWASLFARDGKFQGAREWSIAPWEARVDVTDIESPDARRQRYLAATPR
jgi:hypothetical protein